jgi:hypothetical protein
MKKVSMISLTALLLAAVTVGCQKTVPQPSSNCSTGISGATARSVPNVMVAEIGTGMNCVPGNGICTIEGFRILRGSDECGITGDITPAGHLLLTANCGSLNPISWDKFLTTGICKLNADIVLPQDAVDAICDGQTPSIPHWGGPMGIAAGDYPITINNGGADKRLEIEGTYDSTDGSWSWAFSIH